MQRPIVRHSLKTSFLVALVAILTVAGIQSTSTAIAAPNSQVIDMTIDMDEWALIPEDLTFQAGDTVNFTINNIGRFPHAVEFSNSAIHLHSDTIRGGEVTTMQVTFEHGGEYLYVCPVPGHAELGMVGTLNVEGGSPPPDTGEFLGITLMRLSPRNGSNVDGTSQEVRPILHDFTLAPDDIGGTNVGGEGHWDLFLDDSLVASVGDPTFMLEDLTPGPHTIKVALRNNDGTPLDPPVEAESSIQVAKQIDIELNEWDIIPQDVTFEAGDRVVFNLTNTGRFPHALEVSNSVIHEHSETIGGGETSAFPVTLEHGGDYLFVCPIPGHAELGMVGTLTVTGGDPAPASDEFIGIPLMRLNPRNGTEVEGDTQETSVVLHDFTLAPNSIGGANVGGEGHWALFLNDDLVDSIGTPTFSLDVGDLDAGEHTLRAELRNNDGTPLDPPVSTTRTIVVPASAAQPAPTPVQISFPRTPSVGDATPSGWMLAGVGILGVFLLGSGGLILARRRVR